MWYEGLVQTTAFTLSIGLCIGVFGLLFYTAYKDIEFADRKKRQSRLAEYLATALICGIIFVGFRIFLAPQLSSASLWLSGHPEVSANGTFKWVPAPGQREFDPEALQWFIENYETEEEGSQEMP